jgi:hypothetical protein
MPLVRFDQGAGYLLSGATCVAIGIALIVPGAIIAVHGQNRLVDVDWRLRLLQTAFVVPRPDGALVGARLAF